MYETSGLLATIGKYLEKYQNAVNCETTVFALQTSVFYNCKSK